MPKDLTRDQTYQAFNFEIEMRLDSIDVLESTQENLKIEDNIQRCLIQDRMWEKLGIEPEDYNLAIDQYDLLDDEYVIKRQEEVDMRVSEDLRNGLIEPFFVNPQEDQSNCS